jgi:hypothetical protein
MGLNVRGRRQSRSFRFPISNPHPFSSYVRPFTDAIRGLPLDPAFSIFGSGKSLVRHTFRSIVCNHRLLFVLACFQFSSRRFPPISCIFFLA